MKVKLKVVTKVKVEWKLNGSKMFGHVNDKHQNEVKVNLFDQGHSNVERQMI